MALKYLWPGFALLVLVASSAIHLSTFFGVNPKTVFPSVMEMHLLIFPPFIAVLFYAWKIDGPNDDKLNKMALRSPFWLRIIAAIIFAYSFINFAAFGIFSEGGGAQKRGDRYVLTSHGDVIRDLSEAEFHQHQAYEVRMFSGGWMLFSSASLMLLVGTARICSESEPSVKVPEARSNLVPETEIKHWPSQVPGSRFAFIGLVVYVASVCAILSEKPALGMLSAVPIVICAVLAFISMFRRRNSISDGPFESVTGCLAFVPNAFIASQMGDLVVKFIYLCMYVGIGAAVTDNVSFVFPEEGPRRLSNGELLNNRVWSGLMTLVQFPLFAIGSIGLSYLTELVGRFIEHRKRLSEVSEQN